MKKIYILILAAMLCNANVMAYTHDIILEAKGAYFLSTNSTFRDVYHNGGGLFGAELTFRLYKQLYGFTSVDFLSKKGHTKNFCTPTKVNFTNLGIGLKYLVPFCVGDFYVGLGALPTRLHTKDCSPYVIQQRTKWGCGGIAKIGSYFNLPKSLVLDVFVDYSFVKIPFKCCPALNIASQSAHLDGLSFGGGIGYRFN